MEFETVVGGDIQSLELPGGAGALNGQGWHKAVGIQMARQRSASQICLVTDLTFNATPYISLSC